MTLAEAVLELADEMEREAADLKDAEPTGYMVMTLKGYAKQLRIAAKVATPPPAPAIVPSLSPAVQHAAAIEAARAEFKGKVNQIPNGSLDRAAALEEGFDGKLTELVGCPDDPNDGTPTMIQFPPDAPVGAKTALPSGVYVLQEDRKLHFSAEETAKVKSQIKAKPGSKLILG